MVSFLKDPSGPPLWEENPEAKDIVHIETEKVSSALNNLLSFVLIIKKLPLHCKLTTSRTSMLMYSYCVFQDGKEAANVMQGPLLFCPVTLDFDQLLKLMSTSAS